MGIIYTRSGKVGDGGCRTVNIYEHFGPVPSGYRRWFKVHANAVQMQATLEAWLPLLTGEMFG